MFPKLIDVKPLSDFVLHLKYDDGTEGNVSLNKWATTQVFSSWSKQKNFSSVYIPRENVVAWSSEMEMDADSFYLELKGMSFEELKSLQSQHASVK